MVLSTAFWLQTSIFPLESDAEAVPLARNQNGKMQQLLERGEIPVRSGFVVSRDLAGDHETQRKPRTVTCISHFGGTVSRFLFPISPVKPVQPCGSKPSCWKKG